MGGHGDAWVDCVCGSAEMSYFLPHLTNGWQVDQAILSEDERVVIIRFGRDYVQLCSGVSGCAHAV